jgi:hypothetical protein
MTQPELAAFVQSHLRANGITAILTGGACVSIHCEGRYVSADIDLVNAFFVRRGAIQAAMAKIGFREVARHFVHPDTPFIVEFPPGPLSVGAEPVRQIEELNLSTGKLELLSPTDCVKDRLAAYYHWDDQQCLAQAELVAQAREVDVEEIARWSGAEGMLDKFKRIRTRIARATP